jgi:hypothetical protein
MVREDAVRAEEAIVGIDVLVTAACATLLFWWWMTRTAAFSSSLQSTRPRMAVSMSQSHFSQTLFALNRLNSGAGGAGGRSGTNLDIHRDVQIVSKPLYSKTAVVRCVIRI